MVKERLWNRRFAKLLCIETMLQFGLYLTRPIISSYAVSLGASLAVAGFLAGLLATAALAIRPVSGVVSDRLSKKGLLVVSCALFAVSAMGCAAFRSLPLLGAFLALQGFSFAFKSTIVVSLASLVVPQAKVGAGVGWLGLAYTFACAAAPAVGSVVGAAWGYPATFAVSGALLSVGLVLAVSFKAPAAAQVPAGLTASRPARMHGGWLYRPVLFLSCVAVLLMVAQGVTSSFVVLVGELRGIPGASLYFFAYSLATLAARPLAGKASDRWGVRVVAPPAMLVAAAGMVVMAFSDGFAGVVVAGACMGVGQGSAYCALQAESVRGVPEDLLGRAANTFYLGPDLCMGLGPVVGGFILQRAGVSAMFLFNALAVVLGLALFFVYAARRRHDGGPARGRRAEGPSGAQAQEGKAR